MPSYAQVCGVPGSNGPGLPSGVVNTYFQPVSSVAAGASSVQLNTDPATIRGAGDVPRAGDLVLVMQMQGAEIDSRNDSRYGDGAGAEGENIATLSAVGAQVAGGLLGLPEAGKYEYARVASFDAATGLLGLSRPLSFSYRRDEADGTSGRFRYQLVLVPQFASAVIDSASPVLGVAWNGETGGVIAMDVSGRTTFQGGGTHIDASRLGFRGGYGFRGPFVNDDTSYVAAAGSVGAARDTTKAEGVAGTPRHVWNGDAAVLVSESQGYPGGDYGRGAPGNAGGSGISHNSGGGGGGNGGTGGRGGASHSGDGAVAPHIVGPRNARDVGGFGGAVIDAQLRVVLGGGGGAGDVNGGGLEPAQEGTGGLGGGIVLFTSGEVAAGQVGNIVANGDQGLAADADGAGGGGAGGTVLVRVGVPAHTARLNVVARGGDGGSFNFWGTGVLGHCAGSGGGGGGGVVRYLGAVAPLSTDLRGGAFGPHVDGGFCLGTAGEVGILSDLREQPPGTPGFDCFPQWLISKSASAAAFVVGVPASYELLVRNTGRGPSLGTAQVTDVVPASLTLGTLPAGCTAAGQTVTCTIAAGLAAGASTSFVLPVTPIAAAIPSVENTASVSGGGDPGCPGQPRCTSTITTPVQGPNVALAKTANPASGSLVVVGNTITYTLQATVSDAALTAAFQLTDTLGAGLLRGAVTAGPFTCGASEPLVCSLPSGTATGTYSLSYTATVQAGATVTVSNSVSISGSGGDPDPVCSPCITTHPLAVADLQVLKTVDQMTPGFGQVINFTLQVRNNGPDAATNVVVTDALPSGYDLLGTTPSQGSYSAPLWTVGNLRVGQTETLHMQVRVRASGTYRNVATVRGDQFDPVDSNNEDAIGPTPPSNPRPAVVPMDAPWALASLVLLVFVVAGLQLRRPG